MANLSRVNSWILPKISSLGIKVYKLKWIEEFIEGYHDYRLTMNFNSKMCVGRGIALKEEIAFEKAATEVLERASVTEPEFYENPWATAAYPDEYGAKIRAYRELLCIDRGISHHYTGTGFKKLDLDIISYKINIKKLLGYIKSSSNFEQYLYFHKKLYEARKSIDKINSRQIPQCEQLFTTGTETLKSAGRYVLIKKMRLKKDKENILVKKHLKIEKLKEIVLALLKLNKKNWKLWLDLKPDKQPEKFLIYCYYKTTPREL
jgi:hypothetical protein